LAGRGSGTLNTSGLILSNNFRLISLNKELLYVDVVGEFPFIL
jgi:hypothetical protein